jgi:hypothetical protein
MGDGEIVGRYKLIEIGDAFFNRKRYSRPESYASRVTEEDLSEPPPGSVVRFSTGMYLYAAVRLAERANLGLGFDGGTNWQTTSSNDPEQSSGYGIPKLATWQQILDFARGRRIEVATMWEMIQEGFPSKVVDWGPQPGHEWKKAYYESQTQR